MSSSTAAPRPCWVNTSGRTVPHLQQHRRVRAALVRLEAELVAHADAPVVVAMHKPFWATGAAAGQPDPMHELFVRTGVEVFTGHWHQHLYQQVDGIPYVGVGTSGGAYSGVQDPRLGNAYEYVWGEVRDGQFVLRAVAGGVDLPVDYLSRADSGRLRALRQGGVIGVARGETIEIRIRNVTDAPLAGVLTVDPGGWTVANPEVPYEVAPGETFAATVLASAPASWFPSPRLSLSYPLPDAGPVAFVTPVDVVREAVAPRGAAVVDGRLDDWAGAPSVGPSIPEPTRCLQTTIRVPTTSPAGSAPGTGG